jgi:CheY-like chemotaxis protein
VSLELGTRRQKNCGNIGATIQSKAPFSIQKTPNSSLISVALVEDDVNFQNALIEAIGNAPDIALVSVVGTRAQGVLVLDQIHAEVLLVDLGLPDGSGIDVIRAAHFGPGRIYDGRVTTMQLPIIEKTLQNLFLVKK